MTAHRVTNVCLKTHLHVVLPTPPFPPTKIHLRDFCSIIFFKVGSSGSTSGASSNSSSIRAAILYTSHPECTKRCNCSVNRLHICPDAILARRRTLRTLTFIVILNHNGDPTVGSDIKACGQNQNVSTVDGIFQKKYIIHVDKTASKGYNTSLIS